MEELKKIAGVTAAKYVEDGMVVDSVQGQQLTSS